MKSISPEQLSPEEIETLNTLCDGVEFFTLKCLLCPWESETIVVPRLTQENTGQELFNGKFYPRIQTLNDQFGKHNNDAHQGKSMSEPY